jgi:hypothetical protein
MRFMHKSVWVISRSLKIIIYESVDNNESQSSIIMNQEMNYRSLKTMENTNIFNLIARYE